MSGDLGRDINPDVTCMDPIDTVEMGSESDSNTRCEENPDISAMSRYNVSHEENNVAIEIDNAEEDTKEIKPVLVIKTESETDDGEYSCHKDGCNYEHVNILCKQESGINDSVVKKEPHIEHDAESVFYKDDISQNRQSKPEICNTINLSSLDQHTGGMLTN